MRVRSLGSNTGEEPGDTGQRSKSDEASSQGTTPALRSASTRTGHAGPKPLFKNVSRKAH